MQLSVSRTLSILVWYAVSAGLSQLNKAILTRFPFPLALALVQFAATAVFCWVLLAANQRSGFARRWFAAGTLPDAATPLFSLGLLRLTLPLGGFQFVGKYLLLLAVLLVPIATVSSVKALSPLLIVAGYRVWYHVQFPLSTYLLLAPLVSGVMLVIISDIHVEMAVTQQHLAGVAYAAALAVVFAAQNIYGKRVFTYNAESVDPGDLALNGQVEDVHKNGLPISTRDLEKHTSAGKPSRVTLLMYCSVLGAVFTLPAFVWWELPLLSTVVPDGAYAMKGHKVPWDLMYGNSALHFSQSLLAFHLLGSLSTVSYLIASMLKRLVIVGVSVVMTGGATSEQAAGVVMLGVGLAAYHRWGNKHRG